MVILMLGAQGTGKGTVAGYLEKGLEIPQISTGDIFRANIKNKTELGIEADKYISKGELVPDSITVPMVANRLDEEDCKTGQFVYFDFNLDFVDNQMFTLPKNYYFYAEGVYKYENKNNDIKTVRKVSLISK